MIKRVLSICSIQIFMLTDHIYIYLLEFKSWRCEYFPRINLKTCTYLYKKYHKYFLQNRINFINMVELVGYFIRCFINCHSLHVNTSTENVIYDDIRSFQTRFVQNLNTMLYSVPLIISKNWNPSGRSALDA